VDRLKAEGKLGGFAEGKSLKAKGKKAKGKKRKAKKLYALTFSLQPSAYPPD